MRAIEDDGYGFVVVNFANPDMVGHTGVIPAVVQAVETTDECLGRVVEAVERAGGVSLVIADHGNAETLLQAGRRQPAHGPHDEPRAGDPHGPGASAARRGAIRRRSDDSRPPRPRWII